jgi:hypothetical protein
MDDGENSGISKYESLLSHQIIPKSGSSFVCPVTTGDVNYHS